jgi:uncharacterized protein (TIGR01777 family)
VPVYVHRSRLPTSAEDVFAWHSRPGAFERLTPPWERVRILERRGGIEDGARVVIGIRKGPLDLAWTAEHRDTIPGRQFRDVQVAGPFARWEHTHRFVPQEGGACELEDEITYELPYGPLARLLATGSTERMLARMFRFRHERTRADLARHAAVSDRGPQSIAVTGASGLVGATLCAFLETGGHRVHRVVRKPPRPGSTDIAWNPDRREIDAARLEGLDAVVHLAGENIASGRWTAARKAAIRESRVVGTELLASTLARLTRPPRVLVSASAVGYYGDRGDELVNEESPPGRGFLAEVCQAWEAATAPAREAGIRVVNVRIGVVLSAAGGALATLLTPFQLGLGGVVGSGAQYMSWIALDDLVGAIHHLLFADQVAGPVNAVAPNPVTNAEFTRTLGRVLHRPTVLPLPAVAVRLIFGEMGQAVLLEGARVAATRLARSGFRFEFPELEGALRGELGR